MSQLAPVLEEGQNFKTMSNPLLTGTVPDQYKKDQVIKEDETIFAQFKKSIDDALLEQEDIRKTNERSRLATFTEEKKQEFLEQKKKF